MGIEVGVRFTMFRTRCGDFGWMGRGLVHGVLLAGTKMSLCGGCCQQADFRTIWTFGVNSSEFSTSLSIRRKVVVWYGGGIDGLYGLWGWEAG